ncbi:hypothetical protein DP067_01415 [Mycoplasmopsis anatis]|uniref:Lipoprotein n=1 Tax=Mycoplasmopsis anatis 1340 TaxID=1034808 RepID=F9QCP7_9BACT|nr:hypothetical protein [Mycoplasmopsis anatis]AWX70024.1 hypothetical protein DP067_01415 [Mycoplasmopsis anatis]EGS29464.1 lipoprotein [Mycoplasmopsis anatis 1340]VEU73540.1 Maltose-binding periplasmic proteins/domains [Mycoplasmopsis anatis]
MKFNKFSKLVIGLSGVTSLTALTALSAACDKKQTPQDPGKGVVSENKEIVIAVDGVQRGMYDNVVKEFNKSEYHTKLGYNIKLIEKDVWSALDTTVGATDTKAVPDIFYGPHDRVTSSVQGNTVVDYNAFLQNTKYSGKNIWKAILGDGASDELVKSLVEFGSVEGIGKKSNNIISKFVALRHNQEGIVLATNKSLAEAREELSNPESDSMAELVAKGEAIFRIQDFWYGNGILGGVFDKLSKENPENRNYDNLMSKVLYSLGAKITTGFNGDSDSQNSPEVIEAYKKAVFTAAKLVYPIFDAVYNKTPEEYSKTPWGKKGIKVETLESLFTNDMGQVQNTIWNLLKEKKISYAMVGTWDIQNTQQTANAQTFINTIKVTDDYDYIQAPGSWSFMVNIRNNAYSAARREALVEILKLIYSPKSWLEYYKSDSKIPFVEKQKEQLIADARNYSQPETQRLLKLVKDNTGYDTFDEFSEKFEEYKPVYSLSKNKLLKDSMWVKEVKSIADVKAAYLNEYSKVPGFDKQLDSFLTDQTNNGSVIGLRNYEATIFGIDVNEENNPNWLQSYILSKSVFNETTDPLFNELVEGDGFHVRKIEKFIFGANGDNGSEIDALFASLSTAINENKLEEKYNEVIAKAKKIASFAANKPSDEVIEKATRQLFNNYVYDVQIQNLSQKIVKTQKITKKDGSQSEWTIEKAAAILENIQKLNSIGKIIDVVTSTKEISNGGLGVFKTQNSRIDSGNPQFGTVAWATWNDKTFGSKEFIKSIHDNDADKNVSEEEFAQAIYNNLSKLFRDGARVVESSQSSTVITFDNE